MQSSRDSIDINVLPRAARAELLDFYEFLRSKYATNAAKASDPVSALCDRAARRAIKLPGNYRFNRDELYER